MTTTKNILAHNKFEFVILDKDSEKKIGEFISYNTLLDGYWATTVSPSSGTLNYIQYGSGVETPLKTDTDLGNRIGGKAITNVTIDRSTFYTDGVVKRRGQIRLESSEHVGQSISEVGFASSATSGLKTKSLIKDQNGNPISILKTDTMVIDIYATFYVSVPLSLISGDDSYIRSNSSILDKLLTGTGSWDTTVTFHEEYKPDPFDRATAPPSFSGSLTPVYDAPNKKITLTTPNIPAASGNQSGIRAIELTPGLMLRVPRPGVNYTTILKEVVGIGDGVNTKFTTEFNTIYDPSYVKLYVNDIEQPATVKLGMPPKNMPGGFFLKSLGVDSDGRAIYEWLLKGKALMSSVRIGYVREFGDAYCYGKNSLSDSEWILMATNAKNSSSYGNFSIPIPYDQNLDYRYVKIYFKRRTENTYYEGVDLVTSQDILDGYVIEALTPPPIGATVAVTYRPDSIPKNSNSVLNNISGEITFAEYLPE